MQTPSDARLLRDYAEHGWESAFAKLVARHTNLVYSAALRQVESPDAAAEVAQQAFIGLACAAQTLARKLADDASLAGWLCRSARNLSLNLRRDEFRRLNRERQAMARHDPTPETAPDWEQLRPVLDEAMAELNEPDYDALVLRFYQNQDLRSVGRALGLSDDAAQKRVSRALDKLRDLLSRRGITTSAAALSIVLAANAVQAAPVGLAVTISTAATLGGTTIASTAAATATKAITMTALQKAIVGVTLAVAVGTGVYEARQASQIRDRNQALHQQQTPLQQQIQQFRRERDDATNKLAALHDENERLKGNTAELLKLRGEVAQLRAAELQAGQLKTMAVGSNDPFTQSVLALTSKAAELNRYLTQMPDKNIPEIRLLQASDWLEVAREARFDTEADIRKALASLRSRAKNHGCLPMGSALWRFTHENNGQLPTDLSQLKPYLRSALGGSPVPDATLDAILQRYELLHTGNLSNFPADTWFIAEKASVDKDYDSRARFGNGRSSIGGHWQR